MRPLPARRQGKHLCVLAFRTLEDNFRIILICLWWIGLEALTGWTLEVDTKLQRLGACMCPSESCHLARLKLDNISMCAESLVLTKEVFDVWSVENEMHERPIHNEFVCARRLKIPLEKQRIFSKIWLTIKSITIVYIYISPGTYQSDIPLIISLDSGYVESAPQERRLRILSFDFCKRALKWSVKIAASSYHLSQSIKL